VDKAMKALEQCRKFAKKNAQTEQSALMVLN
jgi:hypothetical protein